MLFLRDRKARNWSGSVTSVKKEETVAKIPQWKWKTPIQRSQHAEPAKIARLVRKPQPRMLPLHISQSTHYRNATAMIGSPGSRDEMARKPTTGIGACCARPTNGQAAATHELASLHIGSHAQETG
jgi:hypothetical protein